MRNFKTKRELAREERNAAIRQDWRKLRMEFPELSKNRIAISLAEKFSLTKETINNIVSC